MLTCGNWGNVWLGAPYFNSQDIHRLIIFAARRPVLEWSGQDGCIGAAGREPSAVPISFGSRRNFDVHLRCGPHMGGQYGPRAKCVERLQLYLAACHHCAHCPAGGCHRIISAGYVATVFELEHIEKILLLVTWFFCSDYCL